MARYIPIRRSGNRALFWQLLARIVGFLLGICVSVVVWVVIDAKGNEWVVMAVSGFGIVTFWAWSWFTRGGLPPIARFRIQNKSERRRIRRTKVKLEPSGGAHEDTHKPELVPVSEGVPNAAAYDIEPVPGLVSAVTACVELDGGAEYEVCVQILPPAESFADGEVAVYPDRVEFVALFGVADGLLQMRRNETELPPLPPPDPGGDI